MAKKKDELVRIKFRGHETFHIRKGWLYKGLTQVANNPQIFSDFNDNNPALEFGIGTNMVKSLKYWLQATGLCEKVHEHANKGGFETTDFGKIILRYDPFFLEDMTWWLIHYKLVTNSAEATAWYWLFNEFSMIEFSREDFLDALSSYAKANSAKGDIADSSLESDFQCIISTYISRQETKRSFDPEDNIECPLARLKLLEVTDFKKKVYRKRNVRRDELDPLILLVAIIDSPLVHDGEVSISKLLSSPLGAARIFNLDIHTLNDYLDQLRNLGLIQVKRTAGLNMVNILTKKTTNEIITEYYERINAIN